MNRVAKLAGTERHRLVRNPSSGNLEHHSVYGLREVSIFSGQRLGTKHIRSVQECDAPALQAGQAEAPIAALDFAGPIVDGQKFWNESFEGGIYDRSDIA